LKRASLLAGGGPVCVSFRGEGRHARDGGRKGAEGRGMGGITRGREEGKEGRGMGGITRGREECVRKGRGGGRTRERKWEG